MSGEAGPPRGGAGPPRGQAGRGRRTSGADWTRIAERGSLGALRLGGVALRLLGRRIAQILLVPVVAYYTAFNRKGRAASRDYLRTLASRPEGRAALGGDPGIRHLWRHVHEFGRQLLDRMILWSGGRDAIEIDWRGDEHLRRLVDEGRGAIFIGAHVGSFDMMRFLASSHGVPVNVLMFTDNAEAINAFFRQQDPSSAVRVLRIDPGSVRTAFAIKSCIDRGEFVGILADRTGLFPGAPVHATRFLGRPACLPQRPFAFAAVLGCPVLLATCLRRGNAAYRVEVSPLTAMDPRPRRLDREEQRKLSAELAEGFVDHLERTCLREPYQWFNFYPFWEQGASD